ncbi:MAG: HlyD family secretion protein, partial [Polyangiales bacterium]
MRHVPTGLQTNLMLTDLSPVVRLLSSMLIIAMAAALAALVWVPWQQSIRGAGKVIAYAPVERQQFVQAPLEGRVTTWYVREGQAVKAGTVIAAMSDNDPDILARIERERDAAANQVQAAILSIMALEGRIAAMQVSRSAAVEAARGKRSKSKEMVRSAARKLDAAKAKYETAKVNLARQQRLHVQGLVSTRTLELAQLSFDTAKADVAREEADLAASEREVEANDADLRRVGSGELASIEAAKSSLQALYSTKAKAEAELAKVEVRLARQRSMRIEAPRDGTVMRLVARPGGEILKAGDPIAVFVPETSSRAVEVWVDGNDAPLITPGRHVRLQFEGWPAVQFVGWPSVAVGTFPGKVAFVDATDDGQGRFRVVV